MAGSDIIGYADNEKLHKAEFLCLDCFDDREFATSKKWHFDVPVQQKFSHATEPCLRCGGKLKMRRWAPRRG